MSSAYHGETLYAVEYRCAGEEGHGLFTGVDDVAARVDWDFIWVSMGKG
jgi:hypothetical protein